MRNILSLSVLPLLLLLLVSLVAVPAVAATVTCPTSCSCLLPAKAKELGYSDYCGGKQAVCGYDAAKNAMYCYENKPVTPAPVPVPCEEGCSCMDSAKGKAAGYTYCKGKQVVCDKDSAGNLRYCFEPPVTKAPVQVYPTCANGCSCLASEKAKAAGYTYCDGKQTVCNRDSAGNLLYCFEPPVTGAPVTCPASCTCTDPEKATTAGLSPCGKTKTVCDKDTAGNTLYCYALPTTVTTTTITPAVKEATKSCTGTCTCLATDKADAAGFSRCSGTSNPCGYDPMNRPMYCYVTKKGTEKSPVSATTTATSAASEIAGPADRQIVITEQAPAPGDSFFAVIGSFFASLFGRSRESTAIPVRCGEGGKICGSACIDPSTDKSNCGQCGNVCIPEEKCIDGGCRNLTSDNQYCGQSAQACPVLWECCDGICKNRELDEENCGGCGTSCDRGETCCDGNCVDTSVDSSHCGSCDRSCSASSGETCRDSRCVQRPEPDYCGGSGTICTWREECCDGRCVSINDDENNCGRCGNACMGGDECCDGECANFNLNEDNFNCGRCRHACYGGTKCCDGQCVTLSLDEMNCGRCGNACDSRDACCSGVCTDVDWDENNCGSCYRNCPWNKECQNGLCCLWFTTWGCE